MTIQFSVIKHDNGGFAVEGKTAGKRTHFNSFHPHTGKPADVMTEEEAANAKAVLEEFFNAE